MSSNVFESWINSQDLEKRIEEGMSIQEHLDLLHILALEMRVLRLNELRRREFKVYLACLGGVSLLYLVLLANAYGSNKHQGPGAYE